MLSDPKLEEGVTLHSAPFLGQGIKRRRSGLVTSGTAFSAFHLSGVR